MANKRARALVEQFGYSNLSSVVAQSKEISEETRRDTDEAIVEVLKDAEKKAREILESQQNELKALRKELLEKEVIDCNKKKG
jgi:ATP-dependent Zn protease